MIGLLALMVSVVQAQASAPPLSARPIESWTCTAREQLDQHVSGMLQMLVYPDGGRRQLSFYINWSVQPGHMAEQQVSWVGIPPNAVQLWKPDEIAFSVEAKRTDKKGAVTFTSSAFGQISEPAEGKVRSLRPNFRSSWVSLDDSYLVSKLWDGWPWEARLTDRNGATLGTQAMLLPRPETAQAMFTRLKAELDRSATERATKCTPNFGPDEDQLMQQVI
jgi:hypothetical protein